MDRSKKAKRRHVAAAPIGGIFVLLAVIGVATVVALSIWGTKQIFNNDQELEQFEGIVMPVLMFDPVPFENATDLDQLFVLRSSVWAAVLEKRESYEYDDLKRMMVPSTDVDVACAKLFGSGIKLTHQSFDAFTAQYMYSDELKAYFVPVDAETVLYTPTIIDVQKTGNLYSLVVGYLPPGTSWMMEVGGKKQEPQPDKYMIYNLEEKDGNYRLVSIKDPPEGAVPGVPSQTVPEAAVPQTDLKPGTTVPPTTQDSVAALEPQPDQA